jgi:hypothetical protein
MAIQLIDGLGDLSKELGETSANQTPNRIKHYNDAVQAFLAERKWPFTSKKDTSLTTVAGQKTYDLSGITDIRQPGGIKEILIGADEPGNQAFLPVDFEQRHSANLSSGKYFYIDEETNELVFLGEISSTGSTITIRYYFVPARIEDVADTVGFQVPQQFRKAIGTLAAAYVQWARYLDAQGNRLYNMYERLLNKASFQQSERNKMNPRKMEHPLRWRGFQRSRPGGAR